MATPCHRREEALSPPWPHVRRPTDLPTTAAPWSTRKKKSSRLRGGSRRLTSRVSGGDYRASKTRARKRKIRCPTAVRPKIPHSNCCKIVSDRPLRGRRGRFNTLLQLLECGIFGRTAVSNDSPSTGKSTTQRPTFTPLVTKNGDACAVPWLPGPAAALARAQPRAHAWGSL